MSKTEFTASANVRITIEVQNLGPYGADWTAEKIHEQTSREAIEKVLRLLASCEHGAGKPKSLPAPQWPEPRPIEEAPKLECILAYVPASSEPHLEGRWLLMAATEEKGGIDGFTILGARPDADRWFPCSILQPTHFLPLPPKPEVRK